MLDSNHKATNPTVTRGRHSDLAAYCLSQSCFVLAERTKKNSNIITFLKQTIVVLEKFMEI